MDKDLHFALVELINQADYLGQRFSQKDLLARLASLVRAAFRQGKAIAADSPQADQASDRLEEALKDLLVVIIPPDEVDRAAEAILSGKC